MQDVFIEYMVKRQRTAKTSLLKLLIIVGAIVLAVMLFIFSGFLGAFSFFGAIFAVGLLYGGYFLVTSMNLEFEYSITNGEMDVDKIVAQRKRRRLVTVKWRDIEAFGRYIPSEHAGKTYGTKIFACDTPYNEDLWYCVTRAPQKGQVTQVFLVFNASEKMLEAIKKYLPKQILHAVFKRH